MGEQGPGEVRPGARRRQPIRSDLLVPPLGCRSRHREKRWSKKLAVNGFTACNKFLDRRNNRHMKPFLFEKGPLVVHFLLVCCLVQIIIIIITFSNHKPVGPRPSV